MKWMLDDTRLDMLSCEWKELLDDFAFCVKANQYEKMPYPTWRGIMNDLKAAADFEVFSVAAHNQHEIRVYGYRDRWTFFPGDGSFGDYLFDTVLRGAKNMYLTDTRGIDYNKILNEKMISYDLAVNTASNDKKENNMKFNFDFGPVSASTVRMSMYGLAVKNKTGSWVSFDAASGNIVDVDVFNFDGAKFLYKMPVAVKDITVGDVVIHNGAPMFVLAVGMKTLTVVDVINGERKDIMLARSPFGFDFATKVVNFLGNMMTGATVENPFGNMWMLMAMSGDNSMEDMLPMALMMGGSMDMSNPMLMWALMGNRTNDPMMLAMAMGAFNKSTAPTHECKCGGNCDCHE